MTAFDITTVGSVFANITAVAGTNAAIVTTAAAASVASQLLLLLGGGIRNRV